MKCLASTGCALHQLLNYFYRNVRLALEQVLSHAVQFGNGFGVHWIFDAFKVKGNGDPNLSVMVGGVPLGIKIAEDIFSTGMRKSPVGPRA